MRFPKKKYTVLDGPLVAISHTSVAPPACRCWRILNDKPGRAAPSAAPCEETNGWKDESCFCEDSSGMVNRDSVVRVNRETFVVVNRDL